MAKILVVEDHAATVKFITSILSSKGHVTVHSAEPRDAMEKLKTEYFDMVISDVMMPGGITGFDFIRTLRSLPDFLSLPILLVTGRRERKDVEKGIVSGADDYLIKPVDPEILLSKVDSLLLKRTKNSESFVKGSVKASASWDAPNEIVEITEVGLQVQSTLPIPMGLKLKLKSDFFTQIGITPPLLRVVGCEALPGNNLFRISLHFVGLTEKDLTPIRIWIRTSLLSNRVG